MFQHHPCNFVFSRIAAYKSPGPLFIITKAYLKWKLSTSFLGMEDLFLHPFSGNVTTILKIILYPVLLITSNLG